MEKVFQQFELNKMPFQDPMGRDAHRGLERFLDKFHQPGVPNYTIITDPEYYVFLWFHDSNGNLINCPYVVTKNESNERTYSNRLLEDFDYDNINKSHHYTNGGIQGGAYWSGRQDQNVQESTELNQKCLDLTPFVREATLPEISPAGAEKIKTLFGETTAGSFSPYASDGQKSITLSMLDTEFCILDAIFYPWMKDINSPWWYKPYSAYTEWATPYPMATMEIQRPRMRYSVSYDLAKGKESRNDIAYVYYSYKFIGVKPTSYQAFEINGGGRNQLLRTLTMVADMCIVDLTTDARGTQSEQNNFGRRSALLFDEEVIQAIKDADDEEEEERYKKLKEEYEKQQEEAKKNLNETEKKQEENKEDTKQQNAGDQPGKDEDEKPTDNKDGTQKKDEENTDDQKQSEDSKKEQKESADESLYNTDESKNIDVTKEFTVKEGETNPYPDRIIKDGKVYIQSNDRTNYNAAGDAVSSTYTWEEDSGYGNAVADSNDQLFVKDSDGKYKKSDGADNMYFSQDTGWTEVSSDNDQSNNTTAYQNWIKSNDVAYSIHNDKLYRGQAGKWTEVPTTSEYDDVRKRLGLKVSNGKTVVDGNAIGRTILDGESIGGANGVCNSAYLDPEQYIFRNSKYTGKSSDTTYKGAGAISSSDVWSDYMWKTKSRQMLSSDDVGKKKQQRSTVTKIQSVSEHYLFKGLENALREAQGVDARYFKVDAKLVNNEDGNVSFVDFGMVGDWLSSAMAYVLNQIDHTTNSIYGVVDEKNHVLYDSPGQIDGYVKQIEDSTNQLLDAKQVVQNLVAASTGIVENMEFVGRVASSAYKAASIIGDKVSFVGEFGQIIDRIVVNDGIFPTPVETYVQMATKMDSLGATMIEEV